MDHIELTFAPGRQLVPVVPDWAPALVFEVYSEPIPQGSMRAMVQGKRAVIFSDNPRLKAWRRLVQATAMSAQGKGWKPISGAVVLAAEFYMPKPANRPKGRRVLPSVKPDDDKLCRALCDGLSSAGTYEDDARVVDLISRMRYAEPNPDLALPWEPVVPCARVAVWELGEERSWNDRPIVPFEDLPPYQPAQAGLIA
ncbi:RusA family crossover junction endodeoxyribonuclease [Microbacterium enclense]|uniref:RusA family crossover junction endodeoxyribonuclease n=1 Tax=Microbacterium enclense TaxID=993073 RepID=UPI003F8082A0